MKITLFKILLLSFLLSLLVSPLRAFDFGYSGIAGFVVYFFFSIFCLRRYRAKASAFYIIMALVAGLWLMEAPMRLFWFNKTLGSLPDILIKTCGIPCGYFYWRLRGARRYLPGALGLALSAFMLFAGYGMWLHKLNFGSFTGRVTPLNLAVPIEGFTKDGEFISNNDFTDKIVLLDFWHTSCGVCFEKFPKVQSAFEKFKSDPGVIIVAVDKPLEEDKPGQAFEMITREGYSFDVVVSKDENMPDNLGIRVYPTTLVIDRRGEMVYKGDIEGAVKMVDELKQAQ
jgi:thiol-disulfide isomerase/thioredoxin